MRKGSVLASLLRLADIVLRGPSGRRVLRGHFGDSHYFLEQADLKREDTASQLPKYRWSKNS
jgi:hypothetical protein